MSEDKEWLKGSIWPKWFKKIEALEKIIGDPVFYKKDIGSIIDYIEKEISELEQKLIGMVNSNTSNQDRIIALEKKLLSYRTEIYENYDIEFEDIGKKIEALEKRFEISNESWDEHIIAVEKQCKLGEANIFKRIKVLEKKLSGENARSAAHTEKDCSNCKNRLDGYIGDFPVGSPCLDCHDSSNWDSKPSLTKAEKTIFDEVVRKVEGENASSASHTEYIPKCKTCGSELSMDLNNDYFCMKSVINEEKHDDHFPNPFTLVRKEDLKKIQKINNNIDYGSNQKQSRINWYLNKYLSEKKS